MASPMKVDEGRLRGQGEAGKKRGADENAPDRPRKVSLPSATTLIPGSIPRGAVTLDPYRLVCRAVNVFTLMMDWDYLLRP